MAGTARRITYRSEGVVGVVVLDDGKANAIGPAWLEEAKDALDTAEADGTRALVIFGRERFFSAGLDMRIVPSLPPEAMRATSLAFVALVRRLFLFPKPVVAASAGHALAGGFMLSCAADVRLAVDGSARYGLTEVRTGVPVIGPTAAVVAAALPPGERVPVMLHGRELTARDAAAIGVVHELVADPAALHGRAMARAEALAGATEPRAYAISKLALRRPLVDDAAVVGESLAAQLPPGNPLAGRSL